MIIFSSHFLFWRDFCPYTFSFMPSYTVIAKENDVIRIQKSIILSNRVFFTNHYSNPNTLASTALPIMAKIENTYCTPSQSSRKQFTLAYVHNPTHISQIIPPKINTKPNSIVSSTPVVSIPASPNRNVRDMSKLTAVATIDIIELTTLLPEGAFLKRL